MILLINICIS